MALKKLSEMNEKERMRVFIAFVIGLFVLVTGIIVVSNLLISSREDSNPKPSAPTTVEPETNPSSEPSIDPSDLPTDENDIDVPVADPTDPPEADEDHEHADEDNPSGPKAQAGLLEWCNIGAGETFEQRQARMAPYFNPKADEYKKQDLDQLFERKCKFEAISSVADQNADGSSTWYITLLVASRMEEGGSVDGGYTQFEVRIDNTGILSIDD